MTDLFKGTFFDTWTKSTCTFPVLSAFTRLTRLFCFLEFRKVEIFISTALSLDVAIIAMEAGQNAKARESEDQNLLVNSFWVFQFLFFGWVWL